jgi:para-nitrobenzyl esterase
MHRRAAVFRTLAYISLAACGGSTTEVAGGDDGGADAGACASNVAPAAGLVATESGAVQGSMTNGAWGFLGIPYAAPPVGGLRWSAPQAYGCWSSPGPLAATSFGSKCLQVSASDPTIVVGAEDCLTLNVWAPASATPSSKLPVLFFIHGGGNVQGSSADTSQGGSYLYAGVVVVTFNYRLGAMGFLAHPSFGAHPGNYGTLDQIFALGWVSRNIAAFGGDPARVLLFGQSAGAVDVCALVASPLANGLFSAALMESGGCVAKASSDAQSFAQSFARKVQCDAASDPAACLRALDPNAVTLAVPEPASVSAPKQGDYQPNVDGAFLLDTPENVILAGKHNHVPFVVGSNSDETSLELAEANKAGMTQAQYQAAVLAYAGNDPSLAGRIVAMYPASSYGDHPLSAFIAVTTDSKFVCTARYVARSLVKGQPEPVWRYFFTHHLDDGGAVLQALGAWHGLELAFVFRDLAASSSYVPSTGEVSLAGFVDGYWSSLASTGTPNGGGAVDWPAYDASTDPYLGLDDTIAAGTGVRTANCDFWDQVLGR